MRKKWTPEEDQIIIDSRNAGLKYKQIVPLLPDRNLRTISVRGHKITDTKSREYWSEEDRDNLKVLVQENVDYKDIAYILERTYIAVKTQASLLMKAGELDYRAGSSRVWKGLRRENFPELTDEEFQSIS